MHALNSDVQKEVMAEYTGSKSEKTPALSTEHNPLGTHGLWGDKNAQLPAYLEGACKISLMP